MNRVISIVPQSAQLTDTGGILHLADPATVWVSSGSFNAIGIAEFLQNECRHYCNVALLVRHGSATDLPPGISIQPVSDSQLATEGSYRLTVTERGVTLRARTPAGLFYAVQTLLQLMSADTGAHGVVALPTVDIIDYPRFSWRGMHLDVSRHFFPTAFIKRYIDLLAFHKMNVFHWHLTDDQGWRIEIKSYPRLTEIGAWRTEPDGQRYGGFYTQAEVRDVVAYAAARFVTIIPEIELPGHASAALASYPGFSCTGGPFSVETRWGVFDDVYCPGNEATFVFLQNVFNEVAELFPGPYVHIGGDECPKVRWKAHELCQRRMKEHRLTSEDDLQAYFVARIAKHLTSLNRRLVGWDEILDGGAPEGSVIMAWRTAQKGIEAARAGHDVVMTPMPYCYYDHYQGRESEPKAIGGFTPLPSAYAFEPVPDDLLPDLARHIIGAQANVWTEYMPDEKHVEYMAYPRACALSEALWSPPKSRSYTAFLERLRPHLRRLDARGVNYRRLTD